MSGRRRRGLLRGRESFFAGHLAAAPGAEVIDSDDLVTRWSGLAESLDLLAEWALEPVARGPSARRRRFDGDRRRCEEWVEVAPSPVLVVGGCGIGHEDLAPYPRIRAG